jgi:dTDP-4-amino-4,6-dideoxygalactose transaminase
VELILSQWDEFDKNIYRRQKIASIYRKELSGHPAFRIPIVAPGVEPAWIQFPLLVKNKQHFYRYMQKHGVDVTWTYRYNLRRRIWSAGLPNFRDDCQVDCQFTLLS